MKKINYKTITLEQLAAIVSQTLKNHNIDTILVGGGCVSIYSRNRYQSYDLDYVTYEDMKKVILALKGLNFIKKERYFHHPDCPYFIEFVSPPVAIGDEPITNYEYYKTALGTIKMLTPTDSVKDRLASFYYWDDHQGLDQAISICLAIPEKIDLQEIQRWSVKESQLKKYEVFLKQLNNISN